LFASVIGSFPVSGHQKPTRYTMSAVSTLLHALFQQNTICKAYPLH